MMDTSQVERACGVAAASISARLSRLEIETHDRAGPDRGLGRIGTLEQDYREASPPSRRSNTSAVDGVKYHPTSTEDGAGTVRLCLDDT
jgi:hypothetical protein